MGGKAMVGQAKRGKGGRSGDRKGRKAGRQRAGVTGQEKGTCKGDPTMTSLNNHF